jgi:hypothetical protein
MNLEINDENIISWIDESYYIYVPDLISEKVLKIKVKITIDNSYKNMYFNNLMLLKFIDNIVLNLSIQKVNIHWDINNEKYFINITSNVRKYKIYVNVYMDSLKLLSLC